MDSTENCCNAKRINVKNQISPDWPEYMLKKNQELCKHHSIRMDKNVPKPARKQETGHRIGMSFDFPLNTTKVTKFHPSSVSVFTN